jgi:hypothetical protein
MHVDDGWHTTMRRRAPRNERDVEESKIARLRRCGWKVGTSEEFLELTEAESAFIEVRLSLAALFRATRVARGLTQVETAKLLESSQSRVAKMEAAEPSVSVDLLVRAILVLGATRAELGRAIESAA